MNSLLAQIQDDKPLLTLVRDLILMTSKMGTNLSNIQLKDILRREFSYQIEECTDIEIGIYVNALKLYLKQWPGWDEIENLCRTTKPDEAFAQEQYLVLKSYLQEVLSAAKKELEALFQNGEANIEDITSNKKVIMEVCCSRQKLKSLFFRKPNPKSLTIFNLEDAPAQSTICTQEKGFTFEGILNWPDVKITVKTSSMNYYRKISGNNRYKLVNRKLKYILDTTKALSKMIYSKPSTRKVEVGISQLKRHIDSVESYYLAKKAGHECEKIILDMVRRDIGICSGSIFLNVEYQYYLSNYSYKRCMSVDNTSEPFESEVFQNSGIDVNNYDLELKEVIEPTCTFSVQIFNDPKNCRAYEIFILDLECLQCKKSYDSVVDIEKHFNDYHRVELDPDWSCSKCNGVASSESLSQARWNHVCLEEQPELN